MHHPCLTTRKPRRPAAFSAAGLLALLVVAATVAGEREASIADEVNRRFQATRREAGLAPIRRDPQLDGVALARAERIAALPHNERLSVADPVEDEVREAGILRYRRVVVHLDMQRGFRDPPAAFERNWHRHPSWKQALDSRYESVGIAVARGADDWLILVVVLLDPLELPQDLESTELRVAVLINRERASRGLDELAYSGQLAAIARGHSGDMAHQRYFAHVAPDGRAVGARVTAAGETYRTVAENIYRVRGSESVAEDAVSAWMNSPGHRKNILDDAFGYTGVGIAVDAEGTVYFTQVFLDP